MKTFEEIEQLDAIAPPGAFSSLDSEVCVPEIEKIPAGGVYLEVGVDRGKSLWMARQVADKTVKVYGVDIKDDPKIDGTIFIQGDSKKVAKTFTEKIDVIFIDGDHSYKGCKADIKAWYPHMRETGVMLFHDCDESSPGVMWAVSEFATNYKKGRFYLFKYNGKNTSMAKITL